MMSDKRRQYDIWELRVYTDNFGTRKGDNCLLADLDGKIVGAVWKGL